MLGKGKPLNCVIFSLDVPRTLKSHCRLVIRKAVTKERLKRLDSLPLPAKLISYLQHELVCNVSDCSLDAITVEIETKRKCAVLNKELQHVVEG